MKILTFFSALLLGGFFLTGKAYSQHGPPREVAEIKSQVNHTVSDNYKDQFRDRKVVESPAVWHQGSVTVHSNYKQQTGARDRQYDQSASVPTEVGIVKDENYKHQVPS